MDKVKANDLILAFKSWFSNKAYISPAINDDLGLFLLCSEGLSFNNLAFAEVLKEKLWGLLYEFLLKKARANFGIEEMHDATHEFYIVFADKLLSCNPRNRRSARFGLTHLQYLLTSLVNHYRDIRRRWRAKSVEIVSYEILDQKESQHSTYASSLVHQWLATIKDQSKNYLHISKK